MLIGSLLALVIAATRTVLSYDEHSIGLSRAEVHAVNPRLLAFMPHDRVTLAGTMVAIGVRYCGLAWFGIRRGQVFVASDLEFMETTAAHLDAASPHLVAHDRATLGGTLVSGLGLLLASFWGYRNGSRWLWWMFLGAGARAYGGVLGVHLAVGYTAFEHLAPAFAGLALYAAALALSHRYLCRR